MTEMWTSKLGQKFPKELIDRLDGEHHKILQRLRKERSNSLCAECADQGTTWASVNLGVFLCLRCADVHRALGTHISKVKGCSGTYLWGPDEIKSMQDGGNAAAEIKFGGSCASARPAETASKEERVALCRKKYEQRFWAPTTAAAEPEKAVVAKRAERTPVVTSGAQDFGFALAAPPTSHRVAAAQPRDFNWFDEMFADVPSSKDSANVATVVPVSDDHTRKDSAQDCSAFIDKCLWDNSEIKFPACVTPAKGFKQPALVSDVWGDFGAW